MPAPGTLAGLNHRQGMFVRGCRSWTETCLPSSCCSCCSSRTSRVRRHGTLAGAPHCTGRGGSLCSWYLWSTGPQRSRCIAHFLQTKRFQRRSRRMRNLPKSICPQCSWCMPENSMEKTGPRRSRYIAHSLQTKRFRRRSRRRTCQRDLPAVQLVHAAEPDGN